MRNVLLGCAMMLTMTVQAQWKVGATVGTDYNVFSMDKQYQNDWQLQGRWGFTMGVTGQYDVNDWLGVRADLNWTQKNHRRYRDRLAIDHKYLNDYLLLPVMASLNVGSEKWRGFVNLGVYGGYWLSSHREGSETNTFTDKYYTFSEKVSFSVETHSWNARWSIIELENNIPLKG